MVRFDLEPWCLGLGSLSEPTTRQLRIWFVMDQIDLDLEMKSISIPITCLVLQPFLRVYSLRSCRYKWVTANKSKIPSLK